MLAIYLRHHAAASRGGLDLFKRSSRSQLSPEARRQLVALADEVNEDRQRLLESLRRLDIRRTRAAEVLVGVAETLGRLDVPELDVLINRAAGQQDRLEDLRRQAVAGSLVAMAGMTH